MLKKPLTLGKATRGIYTLFTIFIIACIVILCMRFNIFGMIIPFIIVLLPIITILLAFSNIWGKRAHKRY
jgi:hypothetical protein